MLLRMSRWLIINAYGLGIDAARSHGIFETMEHGCVTSASLLVNMPDSLRCVRKAKHNDLPVGLHLNLSEGSPICSARDIPSLVNHDAFFLGRDATIKALDERRFAREHIEREIRAQLEWFMEHRGETPTHVDSHHNVHIHPQVVPLLAPILESYGIQWIRIPCEPGADGKWEVSAERLQEITTISAQAEQAKMIFHNHSLRSTDHFRGLAMEGEASARRFRHILCDLPKGTTDRKSVV